MIALVNVPHTSGKSGSNKPELLGGNGKEEDANSRSSVALVSSWAEREKLPVASSISVGQR